MNHDNCDHSHYGYIQDKDRYLARLKRIEGQVRGIQRMIDEDKYCICLLYTSPSPRDKRQSRMPSSA